MEAPRALKDVEDEVEEQHDKIILISEQHLNPRIKVFLFSMHDIRSTIRL